MRRIAMFCSVLFVLVAGFVALVMRTREFDLAPCSPFNEFHPCGHWTDYRIGLRVAIFALGIIAAAVVWWWAGRARGRREGLIIQ
jgi:hypothetical protein